MLWVGVRVNEADCNGVNVLLLDFSDDGLKVLFMQRFQNSPVPFQAFAHLMNVAAGHKTLWLSVLECIQLFSVAASNRVEIAQAGSRNQEDPRPLSLQKGVYTHCSPMHQKTNIGRVGNEILEAINDRPRGILRR